MNIQPEVNNMNGIGLTNGSSDAAEFSHQNNTDLDTEGYTPTYDEAFPELPVSNVPVVRNPGPAKATSYSGSMQAIRASTITQVFRIPVEDVTAKPLGDFGDARQTMCRDVFTKTGASIELSYAKDKSLNILATGKPSQVAMAKREILKKLQTGVRYELPIPVEHHKFILGKGGNNLKQLEANTGTHITIPKNGVGMVIVAGIKEDVEKACHEIQVISDRKAKEGFERLEIPRIYHPFIQGPNQETVQNIMMETGTKINIPPPSVQKDEVTISGDKDGVNLAKDKIIRIYKEKERCVTPVSIEVKKSQHKYVIGPKGHVLQEILASTGVSVEMPPLDSEAETITLRGEPDRLGAALTQVYERANSVSFAEVEAPRWLHRFMIGRSGENIKKITQDLDKLHIEFSDDKDKITLEGPPQQVDKAREALETFARELRATMDFAEVEVDYKYHSHIIGKNGANVNRIKEETKTAIIIPNDSEKKSVIRIEGSPQGVAKAKAEILEMAKKLENERSRDIIIESKFHRSIIGPKGEGMQDIRKKFPEVRVSFPEASSKSDIVNIRGPKDQVDKVYAQMKKQNSELIASNYKIDVPIFKKFHRNIIGRGGATIKKIRDETGTRIELPAEGTDSNIIKIIGHKAQCEDAREKILAIQNELESILQEELIIPHKLHNAIIGAKGRLIRSIMDDCGGVTIKFPPGGSNSDKVIVRGPKDDVEKAKSELLQLAKEKELSSFTDTVKAKGDYHRFLIGRGGANIRKVRDNTGARIIFPTKDDDDQELIHIIGKKEAVQAAKEELEKAIKQLDNIVEDEVNVDVKHHRHFVARQGKVLTEVIEDFGGVSISFPRYNSGSERVVLKGASNCVAGAKDRIIEIVKDLESMTTIEVVIEQKHHRSLMGAKGATVQGVQNRFNVHIRFPERSSAAVNGSPSDDHPTVNGDGPTSPTGNEDGVKKCDIIQITGKIEQAELAKQALLDLIPINQSVKIPFDYHRYIIGQKGANIRAMMNEFDVNILIPPARDESDDVTISGPRDNVAQAVNALNKRVDEIEAENEDKALRNFQLEVFVDPKYHPKIIGRKGVIIDKIRKEHEIQIQVPSMKSGADGSSDVITLTGYERNCEAAKEEIERMVKELEDQTTIEVDIDPRVHRRLIGARGASIRRVMDQFKVDIRFPRPDNPDGPVAISGAPDNVEDARDHLLVLEEEYLDEVRDQQEEKDLVSHYMNPPSKSNETHSKSRKPQEFVVRDAPWNKSSPPISPSPPPAVLNMADTEDFPAIGSGNKPFAAAVPWGPRH
ncbi:vigilin-like [Dendronephthya gigantea]|uniref:vigilin-like n=1 Tax=Dendronephthya gigantea TaxID=151771 RepID=UPI0010692128|nr:vigilin-like [Dendronephthya gigantea]